MNKHRNRTCIKCDAGDATKDEFREKLAALCHEQWAGWMEYLFNKCKVATHSNPNAPQELIIPHWLCVRWQRQIQKPYADLSEKEKERDRKEADKFLNAIK